MQYRNNPRNNDKISALGFGCMRFSGDGRMIGLPQSEKAEKMIKLAFDKGVNFFDTAYIYAGSEAILGKTLAKFNIRSQVMICTKMPLFLTRTKADLDKYFYKQLERLQTDYIDYYLFHMLSDMATWQKLLDWDVLSWIKQKKETGQIKNIGFSFHGSHEIFMQLLDAYDWEAVLVQYNYSDENYQAGITGIRKAHERNIPVFIMEPLLGGQLVTSLPKKAVECFKRVTPPLPSLKDGGRGELSLSAWGLRWLWNHPEITCVLSGMSQIAHVEENCQTAENCVPNCLSEEELNAFKEVKKIFSESFKIPCTGCRYCLPCPFGVDIPSCFTAYNTAHAISKRKGSFTYTQGTLMGTPSYASLCQKCGKCESHCPQKIEIIKSLEEVKKYMEGFKFKVMKIIKKIL